MPETLLIVALILVALLAVTAEAVRRRRRDEQVPDTPPGPGSETPIHDQLAEEFKRGGKHLG